MMIFTNSCFDQETKRMAKWKIISATKHCLLVKTIKKKKKIRVITE